MASGRDASRARARPGRDRGLWADPLAALILAVAGLLVPIGMALAGIGAAAASRRQFVALARLQARFLDRVRGIATIVLAGRRRPRRGG